MSLSASRVEKKWLGQNSPIVVVWFFLISPLDKLLIIFQQYHFFYWHSYTIFSKITWLWRNSMIQISLRSTKATACHFQQVHKQNPLGDMNSNEGNKPAKLTTLNASHLHQSVVHHDSSWYDIQNLNRCVIIFGDQYQ